MKHRIACFHLFNDYSGSPKVLYDVLDSLSRKGVSIDLISSRGGVLDSLSSPNIHRRSYRYHYSPNAILTMARYSAVQILTFCMALRYAFSRNMTFYINTILPIGPALAGKLTGKRIVYHYHENAFVKGRFYKLLAKAMELLADEIICVSTYQASFLSRKKRVSVIPNSLSPVFVRRLKPDPGNAFSRQNVLMLSSLKTYKGTREFIGLAESLSQFNFTLVINDTQNSIDRWIMQNGIRIPPNLNIYPRTDDVTQFYNRTSLVINLSNPDQIIETFGLTALEAMSCALPVIVPPVGGIAEMVTDGINGYRIKVSDKQSLLNVISAILTNRGLYAALASNALEYSSNFSSDAMIDKISEILFPIYS